MVWKSEPERIKNMNTEKMHIEPNTVQETLVIPLWGRKYCSEIYSEIYNDPMAAQIMEKLDYDFSALEAKKHKVGFRFGYLGAAARYTDLSIEVRNYCKEHPACAVVNLGCIKTKSSTIKPFRHGSKQLLNIGRKEIIEHTGSKKDNALAVVNGIKPHCII